jgi:D-alanyl-D-alanine carboxypeptidase/D-alanyl-D-alanine-endopeptidase (penicillin-binding protein 4)
MGRLAGTFAAAAVLLVNPAAALAAPSAAQRRLDKSLSASLSQAGGQSGAYVVDLTAGKPLFAAHASTGRLPASVEKLYTTSTALLRFGPGARLSTRVLGVGSVAAGGAWHGSLFLKGSGDPTFGSLSFDQSLYGTGASMHQLVGNLIRSTGITSVSGHIVGDESYFDSLRGTAATGYQASPFVEGELSALSYNRGFTNRSESGFQRRPALFATQRFAAGLRSAGVSLAPHVAIFTGKTSAQAKLLAAVHSPRMATLIRLTNAPSDNYFAEMLLKRIGARFGAGGTTAAGATVVRRQLAASFAIHPRLDDGSGLSRDDSTSPRDVVSLLGGMAKSVPFVNSLAIAGETGTMQYEMQGTPAQGNCRGKTGTLHDVANLVGYCTARDGHILAFAFLMNGLSDSNAGHAIEDRMGVAVARYNG